MPVKSGRPKRKAANAGAATTTSPTVLESTVGVDLADYSKCSVNEIISSMLEYNADPVMERMIHALQARLPQVIAEEVEAEKRARSIVIAGVTESSPELPPSRRQADLEDKVSGILDVLGVECRPTEIYRMGRFSGSKPRLVKVLFPSRAHLSTALSNAHLLRESGLANIYVRRSMTHTERARDFELRQQAREKNRGKPTREWVVYKGELKHVSELPVRRPSVNH